MIRFRHVDDAAAQLIRQALDSPCPVCRAERGHFCDEATGGIHEQRAAANDPSE